MTLSEWEVAMAWNQHQRELLDTYYAPDPPAFLMQLQQLQFQYLMEQRALREQLEAQAANAHALQAQEWERLKKQQPQFQQSNPLVSFSPPPGAQYSNMMIPVPAAQPMPDVFSMAQAQGGGFPQSTPSMNPQLQQYLYGGGAPGMPPQGYSNGGAMMNPQGLTLVSPGQNSQFVQTPQFAAGAGGFDPYSQMQMQQAAATQTLSADQRKQLAMIGNYAPQAYLPPGAHMPGMTYSITPPPPHYGP